MYTRSDLNKIREETIKSTSNNYKISLVVFMPNITTNHAITYTNSIILRSLF